MNGFGLDGLWSYVKTLTALYEKPTGLSITYVRGFHRLETLTVKAPFGKLL